MQKQPKRPSTGEWIDKMWYIHTIACYSAVKKNEVHLKYVTTFIKLKNIILSEKSGTQNTAYYMIPLIGNVQKR